MLGSLVAVLERVAVAVEALANRGPTEDAEARKWVAALNERTAAHAKATEERTAALQRSLDEISQRLVAIEGKPEGVDPQTLKRVLSLEAQVDAMGTQVRSLKGKVYRDPEFHTPGPKPHENQPPSPVVLGGPGWKGDR